MEKKKNRSLKTAMKRLLPVVIIFMLLLTSCGSTAKESTSGTAESGYAAPGGSYSSGNLAAPAPAASGGYMTEDAVADGDYLTEDAEEAYGMEEAAAAEDYGVSEDRDDSDAEITNYDAADAETTKAAETAADTDAETKKNLEKIVYTCSADLQTLEYDESVRALKEAVRSSGGIIQSETESNNNYSWYYESANSSSDNRNLYLTVRIPTESTKHLLIRLTSTDR